MSRFTRNHLQTSSSESRDASIHPLARSFDLIVGSLSRASRVYPPVAANASRTPLARASAALFANDRSTRTTAVGTTRARHSSNTASCTSRRTSIPTDRVSSYSASDAATSIDRSVRVSPRDLRRLHRRARSMHSPAFRARERRVARPPRASSTPRGDDRRRRSRRCARPNVDRCLAHPSSSSVIAFDYDHHRVSSRRIASHLPHPSTRTPRPRPRPPPSIVRARRRLRARARRRRAPARRLNLNPKPYTGAVFLGFRVATAAGGGPHRTRRRGVDARRHNARESGVDNVFHHGTVFDGDVAFVRVFGRARAVMMDGWMDRDRIERGVGRMMDG